MVDEVDDELPNEALPVTEWDPASGPLEHRAGPLHIRLGLALGVLDPAKIQEEADELRESVLRMAPRHLPGAQAA